MLTELPFKPLREIHQSAKHLQMTPTLTHMAVPERAASRKKRVANKNLSQHWRMLKRDGQADALPKFLPAHTMRATSMMKMTQI